MIQSDIACCVTFFQSNRTAEPLYTVFYFGYEEFQMNYKPSKHSRIDSNIKIRTLKNKNYKNDNL